jgi:hypothetical protein
MYERVNKLFFNEWLFLRSAPANVFAQVIRGANQGAHVILKPSENDDTERAEH